MQQFEFPDSTHEWQIDSLQGMEVPTASEAGAELC